MDGIQLVGYVGSVLVAVSLMMNNIWRLRWINLIGAYSPEMAELMAHTLAGIEIERAFVIHGDPGWDEATPVGPFLLFDVRPGSVERTVRDPAEWGLPRCSPEDLGRDARR